MNNGPPHDVWVVIDSWASYFTQCFVVNLLCENAVKSPKQLD